MLLASMYICGRHGEFDPTATKAQTLEGPAYPFPGAFKLRKHRVDLPYYFIRPNNHVGRYPGMTLADGPRLAALYRDVVMSSAPGLPEAYAAYQREMWRAMKTAPWKDVK